MLLVLEEEGPLTQGQRTSEPPVTACVYVCMRQTLHLVPYLCTYVVLQTHI